MKLSYGLSIVAGYEQSRLKMCQTMPTLLGTSYIWCCHWGTLPCFWVFCERKTGMAWYCLVFGIFWSIIWYICFLLSWWQYWLIQMR